MSDRISRVGLVQMRCGAEPDRNFARAVEFIREAAKQGAQIVCLPELFRSQYFCQSEDHKNFELAEEIPGRSTSALGEIARETGVVIIASLFEKRGAGVYHNTAAIIDGDGRLLGKYRKMHPMIALSREILFHAGRSRISGVENGSAKACAFVGTMVSGSARLTAFVGGDFILSNRHRLASIGKKGIRRGPVFCLGNNSAQPRHRQWLLRCGVESRRT